MALERDTYDASQFCKVFIGKCGDIPRQTGWTENLRVQPVRADDSYGYGMRVDGDDFFTGGAAKKHYLVMIDGDQKTASTGDSNAAYLRIGGNNYAANDANYILRGINCTINQRSGGTIGRMNHMFGIQNKSGGEIDYICAGQFIPENYGTVDDEFIGIDVVMKNEGAVATVEAGIRVRNINNSIADAVGAVLLVTDTGANTGFDHIIDASGASITTSVLTIKEDGTVAEKDNSQAIANLTTAGFLKVIVGGETRYIWLASNAPTT